jgi:hypothetical protein
MERPLARMAERGVAQVMGKGDSFHQILVGSQCTGDGAPDLGHLQRVSQPGAIVVPLVDHEHLSLVLQAPKGGGV